jgi:hypothetical protein
MGTMPVDAPGRPGEPPTQKLTFECAVCAYGVVRRTPPERCPMCHSEDAWTHRPWRPFSRGPGSGA